MPRTCTVYRRDRSYRWNYENGPVFAGPFPSLARARTMKEFLGFPVASRFGIAAGILLNARWIACYARLGFDVLTYKTVRSDYRPCYPLPNWVYVEPPGGRGAALRPEDEVATVVARPPSDPRQVTSAVCFGMPSMAPEVWRRDVARARRSLRRGQLLVVSVVGTPQPDGGLEALADDYVRCAVWATAAGADVVEANLSCPNVCSAEGTVYQDTSATRAITERLRAALPSTPLLVKVGAFGKHAALRGFCRTVSGIADGVVLVNGMTRRILRQDGTPAFPGHERAGVLGHAIHGGALEHVRVARATVDAEKLALEVVGVGGVVDVENIGEFFAAGAALALTGGGAAFDPHLAARLKTEHPEW